MQSIYANIVARVYQAGELTHSVSVVCTVRGADAPPAERILWRSRLYERAFLLYFPLATLARNITIGAKLVKKILRNFVILLKLSEICCIMYVCMIFA